MTKSLTVEISIYFILGYLVYLKDLNDNIEDYRNCGTNIIFHINLLAHHVLSIFIMFGWLSNNKYVLLVYCVSVSVTLGISLVKTSCPLTVWNNDMCQLPKNKPFYNLPYILGWYQSKFTKNIVIAMVLTVSYCIYKLRKITINERYKIQL